MGDIWSVFDVCAATGGSLVGGSVDTRFTDIVTDSRKCGSGSLFVALRGEKFDGHDFVTTAVANGAAGVVVHRSDTTISGTAVIRVPDTLRAYGDLARWHRNRFGIPVIGVTGSTGKTTTKDMIAQLLEGSLTVLRSEASFNNEVGLPATLLQLNSGHGAAVLEMAMRGAGQIEYLASIARPGVGVITNIGVSHMELLGSAAAIADAKAELVRSLPEHGCAILPADDPLLPRLRDGLHCRVLTFGFTPDADIHATTVEIVDVDRTNFVLRYAGKSWPAVLSAPGRHNVRNALSAIGAGIASGLSPDELVPRLASVLLPKMRLQIVTAANGARIIADCYNASPDSMSAALEVLHDCPAAGVRWAVLGDMRELGDQTAAMHRKTGTDVVTAGVDRLVTVGKLGAAIAAGAVDAGLDASRVHSCATTAVALDVLRGELASGDAVLVKGSRAMEMERIVEALQSR